MTTANKPKRRFLRFSLRTLLVVMLVICVTLGWKVYKVRKQREAVAWVQEFRGDLFYDYEWDSGRLPNPRPPSPQWLLELLGVDFFHDVVSVGFFDNQVTDVSPLARLTNLEVLDISGTQVSDVSPLAGLENLHELHLNNTHVTDITPLAELTRLQQLVLDGTDVSDVLPLAGLTNLTWLHLYDTKVSDVSPLARLTSIEWLDLEGTQVRDISPLAVLTNLKRLDLAGTQVRDVTSLTGLTNLTWLNLAKTQVSKEDYEQLQEALPNCTITWSRAGHSRFHQSAD